MLSELYVRNLTLINELSLTFGPGLTVLTGETGAGKSILLDAIYLVVGGRSSVEHIRDGEKELDISARFILNEPSHKRIAETLETFDIPAIEDGALLVRRIVSRSQRHRQYVNGVPVTVSQLREIAEPLVDFTGQHAQHALLSPRGQLSLLDAFASNEKHLAEVGSYYDKRKQIWSSYQELTMDERTRANRMDWLKYQIEEIESAKLKVGELERLQTEKDQLNRAQKMAEATQKILSSLLDGNVGEDVVSRLLSSLRMLHAGRELFEDIDELENKLAQARQNVDEVCDRLERARVGYESDPPRLQIVEDRIGDIKHLFRKHGDSVEEILSALLAMKSELLNLKDIEVNLAHLQREIHKANLELIKAASLLSISRQEAAEKLSTHVKNEVSQLGMPDAIFEIEVSSRLGEDGTEVSRTGADCVRFLFSANPGESPRPLEKVASGGEISRVMLAMKHVLTTKDVTMVSVFDEVDAGVGGSIAHAIGEKLKSISRNRQVLCVTHLAQVAALADAHIRVGKSVSNGKTTSSLKVLTRKERVEELARMMGNKEVTELTRKHANEFLKQAGVVT